VRAFRIVKQKFARTAFSGMGARATGGRWNSPGTGMVYTASSLPLAILEWRVHLAQWPPPSVMVIEVEIPPSLISTPSRFPRGWDQYPCIPATAAVGDAWIRSARSAVLRVPSAIVPTEWNYLLNPQHPDFGRVTIHKPRRIRPDPRLGPLEATSSRE
jgi:RES domain-containing protein